MGKRVIFSDLHFGDDQCSLSNQKVAQGLWDYLRGLGQIEELILAAPLAKNPAHLDREVYTGIAARQIAYMLELAVVITVVDPAAVSAGGSFF